MRTKEKARLDTAFMKALFLFLLPVMAFANPIDKSARDALVWENKELAGDVSDWSLLGAALLPLVGADNWEQRGAIGAGYAAGAVVNFGVKALELRERPNGKDRASFYSGHTSLATAAVTGAFLLKKREIIVPTVTLALMVPIGRMGAEAHWLTDCVYAMLTSWLISEKVMLAVSTRF
jgi:membrane-associated phospholipid phosphatase